MDYQFLIQSGPSGEKSLELNLIKLIKQVEPQRLYEKEIIH